MAVSPADLFYLIGANFAVSKRMRAITKSPARSSSAEDPLATLLRGNPAQQTPFVLLTIMLALFVLRPWDIIPALGVVRPMILITALTIGAFLMSRPVVEFWDVQPAKLLVMFFIMICVSVLFSYWQSQSYSIATDYLKQIALFVLIVNLIKSLDRLKIFVGVFVATCSYHGIAAVVDFTAGSGERLTGISEPYFGDPNDLALSLVVVLPLAWWLSTVAQSQGMRFAIYGMILAMITGILASQSRGGLLALLAAFFILVSSQGRRILGPLVVVLAAAIVFAVAVLPSDVFDRYRTITEYQKDESAMTRLAIWKAGLAMCIDHPLTGVGAGTFESVYGQHYIDRKGAGNIWRAAHSSYVEIAAELGVMGIILFFAILSWAVLSLRRSRRLLNQPFKSISNSTVELTKQLWMLNGALLSSVAGFIVGAAFLSRGYDMIFMIILSLIAVVSRCTAVLTASTLAAQSRA